MQGFQLTELPTATPMLFRERRLYRTMRRWIDAVGALAGLVLVAPLLAIAALAILLEDGAPIFFRQRRVGRFERPFTIVKLRTMRKEACVDRQSPSAARDPRITAVGHWLRKTSIDELPQLWNVLRGEMSIVGPRPEMPFIVERYEPWQHLRHLAPPGITGLWQITCRSRIPLDRPEATALDLHYIRNSSTALDLEILLKTVRAVLWTEGAY
jgi:lipopolysaccharide/colanic/teichoic acid biosynthesis glycosyltransferase